MIFEYKVRYRYKTGYKEFSFYATTEIEEFLNRNNIEYVRNMTDTNPSKFHCFDYEYAKQLYDKVCKNFSTNQWMLVKLEELHNAPLDEFKYIKGE